MARVDIKHLHRTHLACTRSDCIVKIEDIKRRNNAVPACIVHLRRTDCCIVSDATEHRGRVGDNEGVVVHWGCAGVVPHAQPHEYKQTKHDGGKEYEPHQHKRYRLVVYFAVLVGSMGQRPYDRLVHRHLAQLRTRTTTCTSIFVIVGEVVMMLFSVRVRVCALSLHLVAVVANRPERCRRCGGP